MGQRGLASSMVLKRASAIRSSALLLVLAVSGVTLGQTPSSTSAVPTCMAPAASPAASFYVRPTQIDMTELLAPPPAEGSEAARRDLSAVLEAQRSARAHHLRAHAISDATTTCGRFEDVLGAELTSAHTASALAFLDRAAREGSALSGAPKKYWHRSRPYAVDPHVERLADSPQTRRWRLRCARPVARTPSCPLGSWRSERWHESRIRAGMPPSEPCARSCSQTWCPRGAGNSLLVDWTTRTRA